MIHQIPSHIINKIPSQIINQILSHNIDQMPSHTIDQIPSTKDLKKALIVPTKVTFNSCNVTFVSLYFKEQQHQVLEVC